MKSFCIAILVAANAHAADLIHGIGVEKDEEGVAETYVSKWMEAGASAAGVASFSVTGISGSVGAETFTYDVTVSAYGDNALLGTRGGADDLLGVPDGLNSTEHFSDGMGARIEISNISNSNVFFHGFVSFDLGGNSTGEGVLLNGEPYIDLAQSPTRILVTEPVMVWEGISIGVTRLRYVDYAFSDVPPDLTAPSAPSGLSAAPTNGIVELEWDDNVEPDFASYQLYRATDASDYRRIMSGLTASAASDKGLVNGRAYYYRVVARDGSGNFSSPCAAVSATPWVPGSESLADASGTHFEDYIGVPDVAALPTDKISDTDWDGEADLLEFKLGSNFEDDAHLGGNAMRIGVSEGTSMFIYEERRSSPGVYATITYSSNLVDWTTNQSHVTELSRVIQPDGTNETVEVEIANPAFADSNELFVRLRVDDALYAPRFAIEPSGVTTGAVSMTAGQAALDTHLVEYYFEALSPGGHDSGWRRDRLYVDTGLVPGAEYAYRARLRRTTVDGIPVAGSETEASRGASARTKSSGARPNIIVFMVDDLGYEAFDIHGDSNHDTPRISEMAREGIQFTQFHSQPLCTPSRVEIMSGQYAQRNYTKFGEYLQSKSFGNFFQDAGYRTCVAGKWQLDDGDLNGIPRRDPRVPHWLGFDEYLLWHFESANAGSRHYNPVLTISLDASGMASQHQAESDPATFPAPAFIMVTNNFASPPQPLSSSDFGPDMVNQFINRFATNSAVANQPFFIYCPMILPHNPFIVPPETFGLPANNNNEKARLMTRYLDQLVGDTLDLIRSDPALAKNTLVIFTADNGTHRSITSRFNGENFQGAKRETRDAGNHVACVAWWGGDGGGIPVGQINTDVVDISDIMATITECAGVPIPQDYIQDGRSFRSHLMGKSRDPRRWTYGHWKLKGSEDSKVIRWARNRHYSLYHAGGTADSGADNIDRSGNFYDVVNDPMETEPLPEPEPGTRLAALKAELQAVLDLMDADTDSGNN
ncbi:Arylsulfatase [Pontiella desulfatans]|uniref:Arylsulfatase n=1 Tax=Pontiella desulfatans TaxID=2750659 RepID=A0A6C2TYD3_PONDE|nr:sulfatase-like hydrolase/transferase [Pontiella desulfatans]SPS73660.1 sulfatase S1_24 [Kiritimatiellales bacterium]VGO12361.1 Arylsulfatase [Pontiella desulfatans]